MEDCPSRRVDVVPAASACPRLAALRGRVALEYAAPLAFRAVSVRPVLRPPLSPEPFQARGIVGELPHELHERYPRVRRIAPDGVVSVHRSHGQHCISSVGRNGRRLHVCIGAPASVPRWARQSPLPVSPWEALTSAWTSESAFRSFVSGSW